MNYGGYIVRLYLRQSSQNGRDAKTIGTSYMVFVRAPRKEGATKYIKSILFN